MNEIELLPIEFPTPELLDGSREHVTLYSGNHIFAAHPEHAAAIMDVISYCSGIDAMQDMILACFIPAAVTDVVSLIEKMPSRQKSAEMVRLIKSHLGPEMAKTFTTASKDVIALSKSRNKFAHRQWGLTPSRLGCLCLSSTTTTLQQYAIAKKSMSSSAAHDAEQLLGEIFTGAADVELPEQMQARAFDILVRLQQGGPAAELFRLLSDQAGPSVGGVQTEVWSLEALRSLAAAAQLTSENVRRVWEHISQDRQA